MHCAKSRKTLGFSCAAAKRRTAMMLAPRHGFTAGHTMGFLTFFGVVLRRSAMPAELAEFIDAKPRSWRRRASTNIPAPAPAITRRCCFASRKFMPPPTRRAGALIRSGWSWSPSLRRACCARTMPRRRQAAGRGDWRADTGECSIAIRCRRRSASRLERACAPSSSSASSRSDFIRRNGPRTSPSSTAESYFNLMPIYEKLRAGLADDAKLPARHHDQCPRSN